MLGCRTSRGSCGELGLRPLVEGPELPPFWAREGDRELLIFFAHPLARDVRYPMAYGQSYCDGPIDRPITIHYGEVSREITLRFEPYQSILLRISRDGETGVIDLGFTPSPPVRDRDLG